MGVTRPIHTNSRGAIEMRILVVGAGAIGASGGVYSFENLRGEAS